MPAILLCSGPGLEFPVQAGLCASVAIVGLGMDGALAIVQPLEDIRPRLPWVAFFGGPYVLRHCGREGLITVVASADPLGLNELRWDFPTPS
jgi:hypothetical protein